MVCFSNEEQQKEIESINLLTNGSVDGLIVSIAKESLRNQDLGHFIKLLEDEIPLVLFDRIDDYLQCDKVIVDDIGAGYKATKHLLKTGCKNIAILTTPNHVNVGLHRFKGYEKALQESNIKVNKQLVIHIDENENIYQQIETLFSEKIDAIFAVNEIYAAIAIRIAKEKGLKVPKDISVIGFTNGLISEYASPSITTIVQHGHKIGEQATELLIDRIENKRKTSETETKIISSEIKVRESTKKIKNFQD